MTEALLLSQHLALTSHRPSPHGHHLSTTSLATIMSPPSTTRLPLPHHLTGLWSPLNVTSSSCYLFHRVPATPLHHSGHYGPHPWTFNYLSQPGTPIISLPRTQRKPSSLEVQRSQWAKTVTTSLGHHPMILCHLGR